MAARKRTREKVTNVAAIGGALVAGWLLRALYLKARTNKKQYIEWQPDGSQVVYFGSDSGPTNTWVKVYPGGGVDLHV